MDLENSSFKCSIIVKNASYLKKACILSRTNAKKLIAVDIYFLLSNQSTRKVLSTCLYKYRYIYIYIYIPVCNQCVPKEGRQAETSEIKLFLISGVGS